MTDNEKIKAAKNFATYWRNRGNEEEDTQDFWRDLLREVFDIDKTTGFILFNQGVKFNGQNGKCDALIPKTKVLIEQKSRGVSLDKRNLQSDHKMLTPFEQARRYFKGYNEHHDFSEWIHWIVTCNFAEFRIYDMFSVEALLTQEPKPIIIYLENLDYDYKRMGFLVDPNDDTIKTDVIISKEATNLISKIRDAFENNYEENHQKNYRDALIKLCIRMVFCLYAADAHIFTDDKFFKYIQSFPEPKRLDALKNVFSILNQKERSENLDASLKSFPYVNGGLFAENIPLPAYNKDVDDPIETAATFNETKNFHWHRINPTIFGSMFEKIFGDKDRRKGGLHYTSVDNIHKVIDSLFLNDFYAEFAKIKRARNNRAQRLLDLQKKMASIKILDPACGSGNFLTESFLALRRLENEILDELHKNNFDLFDPDPIKVKIYQFFGIEINDFAAAIAQLALYIAENQMLQKSEIIIGRPLRQLPLSNYNQIHCTNALQADWNEIAPRDKLSYIIGNPPFVGRRYRSREQFADIANFFDYKDVDYVACWYKKAADFIQGTNIRCAFVGTNSITQGEQVAPIWKNVLVNGVHIDFAHRTFKWDSESDKVAAVHCVIIGFSQNYHGKKFIFDGDKKIPAKNINPYLIDGENIFVEIRSKPLCAVPKMCNGNMPADGKHLSMSAETYGEFILLEPRAKKYIKRLVGAEEFINGVERYCLWLVDCPPEEILEMPLVAERVEAVRQFRLNSTFKTTNLIHCPHLFRDLKNPDSFIIVPAVSSENRRYIPIGFLNSDYITTTQVQIIPEATRYHFGILISSVHMAWTRAICGRLEMRYRYSKDIVYNNFPWCKASAKQKAAIELTAQKILDVRAEFAGKTLAWLYDEKTMPPELKRAHKENDAEVLAAYGFGADMSEPEIVAALLEKYLELTKTP